MGEGGPELRHIRSESFPGVVFWAAGPQRGRGSRFQQRQSSYRGNICPTGVAEIDEHGDGFHLWGRDSAEQGVHRLSYSVIKERSFPQTHR
jgi:hypothetical protein